MVILASGGSAAGAAGAAKLQKACTVLTPAQIESVLGIAAGPPDGSGSKAGCSFDLGDGLGKPGGGLLVTQHYTGSLAKNLWSTAKKSQEKVGKAYWDPVAGIASASRKGQLVAVSISLTGARSADYRTEAVELANLAAKRL